MSRCPRVMALLGLLAFAVACDSEQPEQAGSSAGQLSFATTATVAVLDVWEWYIDANGDGVPDQYDESGRPIDPPIQVQCRKVVNADGTPLITQSPNVPFTHSLRVKVLRSGETEAETITSDDALAASFNLTPYDETILTGQPAPPCSFPEVCTPLGRLTAANRTVIESTYSDPDRVDSSGPGAGITGLYVCPGSGDLGEPRLGGTTDDPGAPPLEFELNSGDTVIVEARKAFEATGGLELLAPPVLVGTLRIDGRVVVPAGTTTSSDEPGSGVAFSFTLK